MTQHGNWPSVPPSRPHPPRLQQPPMQWAPPPVQESGGSGQAGFVLALIGVAMVAIPPLPITIMFTVLGWLLLLLGLIFSLVGYARGRRGSKPVAGIWTSCAGFALGIGWAIFWSML